MAAEIHVAYSISRRGGTSYCARAYVFDRGTKHSFATGIGDSADDAKGDAIRYVNEMHERDGVTAPVAVVEHGRLPAIIVDAFAF